MTRRAPVPSRWKTIMIERRLAPRYDLRIELMLSSETSSDRFRGVCVNLSEHGAQVLTDRAQERGARLRFESRDLSGEAEVIWTRQGDETSETLLGLQFTSLGEEDRQSLLQILRTPTLRSSPPAGLPRDRGGGPS
jgi:c-di-GMP-binding flagellar brake protein YcgR